MTYEELMERGNSLFGFSSVREFDDIGDLLKAAEAETKQRGAYECAAALFIIDMAKYIDAIY